jgi:hypothetical protein
METSSPCNGVVYRSLSDRFGVEIVANVANVRVREIVGGTFGSFALSCEGQIHDIHDGGKVYDVRGEVVHTAVGKGFAASIIRNSDVTVSSTSLYTWGEGKMGELGQGLGGISVRTPSPLNYNASFKQLDCGTNHCIAIDERGNAYAWGQNFRKQLGLFTKGSEDMRKIRTISETEDMLFKPRLIPFSLLNPIEFISCGDEFTVVGTKTGELWTWGAGESGQLGTGVCTYRELPKKIDINSKLMEGKETSYRITGIVCGSAHTIVSLSTSGKCLVWGMNKFGQLGLGHLKTTISPDILDLSIIISNELSRLFAYQNSSAVIDQNGNLYTWGSNRCNRLLRSETNNTAEASSIHSVRVVDNSIDGQMSIRMKKNHKSANIYLSSAHIDDLRRSYNSIHNFDDERDDFSEEKKAETSLSFSASSSLYSIPGKVNIFEDQIISSFSFSSQFSNVLIHSMVNDLSPRDGPCKNFTKLVIYGQGFWDTDRILVKFTPLYGDENSVSKSVQGRFESTREISCKPPRVSEYGYYNIAVSMDGIHFLNQSLQLRIYKDIEVLSITPSVIDLRKNQMNTINLSVQNLNIYDKNEFDSNENPCWPTINDIEDSLFVKLYLSISLPGSSEENLVEMIVPGRLIDLNELQEEITTNNDNHGKVLDQVVIVDESVVIQQDNMNTSNIGNNNTESANTVEKKYQIACDINFDTVASVGSLIIVRGAISINKQDFGAASGENCPLICHYFEPINAVPTCCPFTNIVDVDMKVNSSRDITIYGKSFIPTSKLPSGMSLWALIRSSYPTMNPIVTKKSNASSKKNKGNMDQTQKIEKMVPVFCDSSNNMSFELPDIRQLLTTGLKVDDNDKCNDDDELDLDWIEKCNGGLSLNIFFSLQQDLVEGNLMSTSNSPQKRNRSQQNKKKSKSKETQINQQQEDVGLILNEEALILHLYNNFSVKTSSKFVRRNGGGILTIEGKNDPFPFHTEDLAIIFYRQDKEIECKIPKSCIFMMEVDDTMTVCKEKRENNTYSSLNNGDQKFKIVIDPIPPLFMNSIMEIDSSQIELNGDIDQQQQPLNITHDDDITSHQIDQLSTTKSEANDDEEGTSNNQTSDSFPLALDYALIKILMDGRSDTSALDKVPSSYINLFQSVNVNSCCTIESPNGGLIEDSEVVVIMSESCVPSDNCMIRLRDSNGTEISCTASIETEGIASPYTDDILSTAEDKNNLTDHNSEENGNPTLDHGDNSELNGEEGEGTSDDIPGDQSTENPLVDNTIIVEDTGGSEGVIKFICPDLSQLEPIIEGKDKFVYLDISFDGGLTYDSSENPLLQIK